MNFLVNYIYHFYTKRIKKIDVHNLNSKCVPTKKRINFFRLNSVYQWIEWKLNCSFRPTANPIELFILRELIAESYKINFEKFVLGGNFFFFKFGYCHVIGCLLNYHHGILTVPFKFKARMINDKTLKPKNVHTFGRTIFIHSKQKLLSTYR